MKEKIVALFITLIGLAVLVFSFMALHWTPWGALPAISGCICMVMGIGKLIDPLTKIVFKSEYDS